MEWNRRVALEKELDRDENTFQHLSICFDETSNFLIYPTPIGIKVSHFFYFDCCSEFFAFIKNFVVENRNEINSLKNLYRNRFTTCTPTKQLVKLAKTRICDFWVLHFVSLYRTSKNSCRFTELFPSLKLN